MICKKCGAHISEGSTYCSKCGQEILEKQENIHIQSNEKRKIDKKKVISIVSASIGIIIIIIVLTGIKLYMEQVNYDRLDEKRNTIDSEFSYYVLDGFEEQYSNLKSETDYAIEMNKKSETKNILKKWDELETDVKNANQTLAKEYVDKLKALDISKAYDDEKTQISSYIDAINDSVQKNDYRNIVSDYDKCQLLITDINKPETSLDMSVYQIDATDFPLIRLYVDMKDQNGSVPEGLRAELFKLTEQVNGLDKSDQTITKMQQLNDSQNININIVADVSGSMKGTSFNNAKSAMKNLLNCVQFNVGDKVELTDFSDKVNIAQEFTENKSEISNKIDKLSIGNMTCLYDALYAAVNRTAAQSGAKCVIAFTDGLDNISKCNVDTVISVAQHYRIPIFIIGIGTSLDTVKLQNICSKTGGEYTNISSSASMASVYKKIYEKQKQLYMFEYTTSNGEEIDSYQINIVTNSRRYTGSCNYTFSPNILKTVDVNSGTLNGNTIDEAIGNYLAGFVKALNANDYSYLKPYVVSGSPMESIQSEYVKKKITEVLKNYEILSKVKVDDSTYNVKVNETYSVTYSDGELNMLVQEATYIVKKQSNESWKVYDFDGSVEVIQSIG